VARPIGIPAIDVDRRPREPQLLGNFSRVEPSTFEPLDLRDTLGAGIPLDRRTVSPLAAQTAGTIRAAT
jgi:hypothetical protein